MLSVSRFTLTEEQIAKNPAVDAKVVREAERARKELETLGVWEEIGSRVRSPFQVGPDVNRNEMNRGYLITQSE